MCQKTTFLLDLSPGLQRRNKQVCACIFHLKLFACFHGRQTGGYPYWLLKLDVVLENDLDRQDLSMSYASW